MVCTNQFHKYKRNTRPPRQSITNNVPTIVGLLATMIVTVARVGNAFVPSCLSANRHAARPTTKTGLSVVINQQHRFPTLLRYANDMLTVEPDQLPKIHNNDDVDNIDNKNLPDVSNMKAREMKKELESYGVSTKSLFDKREFENALAEARKHEVVTTNDVNAKTKVEKKKPKWVKKRRNNDVNKKLNKEDDNDFRAKATTERKSSTKTQSETVDTPTTRQGRYDEAMKVGKDMKVSQLKEQLKLRKVSTKGLFDKEEFVKAYANAIADKIPISKATSTTTDANKDQQTTTNKAGKGFWENFGKSKKTKRVEDPYDASYRDVYPVAFDPLTMVGETVLDITLPTS